MSFVRFGFWNTVVSTVVAVAAVTVLKRDHDAGVCDNFAKFLKTAFFAKRLRSTASVFQ